MTTWIIEFDDAYERWSAKTDDEADADIRIAVLQCMMLWEIHGPPLEAEYDLDLDTLSIPIPGTPVIAEYTIWHRGSTSDVFVVDFH